MKILKLIGILVLAVPAQSCETKESGVTFRVSELGMCEQIDTVFLGVPLNMGIFNNDLFIGDFREPMIVHYNLKNGNKERFLMEGRGPKETMPPIILYANPFGDNGLYRFSKRVFDMGRYSIDSLSSYVPCLTNLPYEYQNIIPFSENYFLAVGTFEDGYRYRILNGKGEVTSSFGEYPNFLVGEALIPFDARSMFHQVDYAISFWNRKIVAASSHIMDIIDYSLTTVSNESIKRILLAPYDYEYTSGMFLSASPKDGTSVGAVSVACNNNYIFLLYDPRIYGQKNQGLKDEIWVFEWNGKPVKRLIFEENLQMITADSSDETSFWGLSYFEEEDDEYYQIVMIKF